MAGVTVRVELNSTGIREMARSEGVRAEILRRAQNVARRARQAEPRGIFIASAVAGRNRIHGSVLWADGLHRELAHRILGSSLDAARD